MILLLQRRLDRQLHQICTTTSMPSHATQPQVFPSRWTEWDQTCFWKEREVQWLIPLLSDQELHLDKTSSIVQKHQLTPQPLMLLLLHQSFQVKEKKKLQFLSQLSRKEIILMLKKLTKHSKVYLETVAIPTVLCKPQASMTIVTKSRQSQQVLNIIKHKMINRHLQRSRRIFLQSFLQYRAHFNQQLKASLDRTRVRAHSSTRHHSKDWHQNCLH